MDDRIHVSDSQIIRTVQEKYIDETKQGEAFAIAERPENGKKLFLESYGCQMNFSDSEIVASILNEQGYNTTLKVEEADLILLNRFIRICSVKTFGRIFSIFIMHFYSNCKLILCSHQNISCRLRCRRGRYSCRC